MLRFHFSCNGQKDIPCHHFLKEDVAVTKYFKLCMSYVFREPGLYTRKRNSPLLGLLDPSSIADSIETLYHSAILQVYHSENFCENWYNMNWDLFKLIKTGKSSKDDNANDKIWLKWPKLTPHKYYPKKLNLDSAWEDVALLMEWTLHLRGQDNPSALYTWENTLFNNATIQNL